MTTRELQEELEKERAILKATKDRIAIQDKELEKLRKESLLHRNTEDALEDANTRLTELISNLHAGILVLDENRKTILVNEPFCQQFGISVLPETLIGTDGLKIIDYIKHLFKDPDKFTKLTEEIIAERKPVIDDEIKMVSGHIFSRDHIPVFSQGIYKGHLWKYTDITRNKTIGDTFETQRKFYEQILNNIPADIVVFDQDQKYLFVNPVAVSKAETRKWMIGKTIEEYGIKTNKPPEISNARQIGLETVIATKTPKQWEEKYTSPNGDVAYRLRIMYPVLDGNGAVEIVIAYGVDITERRKIEDHIQLSEKRYRDIFNFSEAWICTHDLHGRIITINPSACKILGYTEIELIGKTIDSLMPEKVRAQFSEYYLRQIANYGKADGIMSISCKSGKTIHLLYQNYLVYEDDTEPYVIGFAQNITQRIYAEEALKRSEEKYKGIIENMNLGMIEMDNEERILSVNQRLCTMSGYELDELIGKKATDLLLVGTSLKRTRNQLSRGQFGINTSFELAVKTKTGEDRWWLTSATPVYNQDNSERGTISILLDITEQKKLAVQLKEAKKETERSSRSKDIFLTNMSHEIRTPLNAIMGLGKLLSKSDLSTQQKNYLNGIENASSNLLGIVNDLLDFSKIEAGKITLEKISMSLETISKQAVNVLSHKAEEKGLILSYEIDPAIAPVLIGDPFRVNQVFMNMLSNCIKFTEKGSVYLKAFLIEESEGVQKILVEVEDTGVGINEEYLDVIFNKFTQEDETVARKFGGTGLGMSITKQLMELMGGTIKVNSKKNVGTTISLTFKFSIGTSRVFEKKRTIKNDTGNISGKRILLVEDNNLNRLLAYTILSEYGAIVREAENGLQAVEIVRNETFDLILMDIQMPVMDGIQATAIIRKEINSTIPILALTANAIKGKEHQFIDAGMNDYIFKPYNEINLVNPIAKWLNKPEVVADLVPFEPEPVTPAVVAQQVLADEEPLTHENMYDLGKLLNMARNDPGFITKMLKLFIEETPQSVTKIVEGYQAGDFATVRYYAHRMKPSITNLGIHSLKDDILKIEFMKDDDPEIPELISKLDKVIGKVIEKMKDEYDLS